MSSTEFSFIHKRNDNSYKTNIEPIVVDRNYGKDCDDNVECLSPLK